VFFGNPAQAELVEAGLGQTPFDRLRVSGGVNAVPKPFVVRRS